MFGGGGEAEPVKQPLERTQTPAEVNQGHTSPVTALTGQVANGSTQNVSACTTVILEPTSTM